MHKVYDVRTDMFVEISDIHYAFARALTYVYAAKWHLRDYIAGIMTKGTELEQKCIERSKVVKKFAISSTALPRNFTFKSFFFLWNFRKFPE